MNSHWKYRRLFEILPGAIAWFLVLLPIFLAVISPKIFAILMIFFIVYWLVKTVIMSTRLILGYRHFRRDQKINWHSKLDDLDSSFNWSRIYHLVIVPTYKEDISILRSSIESVLASNYPLKKIVFILIIRE